MYAAFVGELEYCPFQQIKAMGRGTNHKKTTLIWLAFIWWKGQITFTPNPWLDLPTPTPTLTLKNIHIHLKEGNWKFQGGRGVCRGLKQKTSMSQGNGYFLEQHYFSMEF